MTCGFVLSKGEGLHRDRQRCHPRSTRGSRRSWNASWSPARASSRIASASRAGLQPRPLARPTEPRVPVDREM